MISKVRLQARSFRRVRCALGFCAAVALCFVTSAAAQSATGTQGAAPPHLQIAGDVQTPLSLSLTDVKAMRHVPVELRSEDGRTVVYDGVPIADLLARAGAPVGAALRGTALTSYVVASASDGYQMVFSLAELDDGLTANQIVVADAAGGQPLTSSQGPLRLIAPKDLRPTRSVRMLERLEVVRVKK